MSKNERKREHLSGDFKNLHLKSTDTKGKGGACLWEHRSGWSENNSCCYRWQANLRAQQSPPIYGSPTPNFRSGSKPFTNQAHHLISVGIFHTQITETANSNPDYPTDIIIKSALLGANYNINEQINMIILPTESTVAASLNLPRHLGSHGRYDTQIADSNRIQSVVRQIASIEGLTKIIADYKKECEDAKKDKKPHPEFKAVVHKTQLETLSNRLYELITTGHTSGRFTPGDPLNEIDLSGAL